MENSTKQSAPILGGPEGTVYPEHARRQFLPEAFEDSHAFVDRDPEGFAVLHNGLHVEELVDEAEERAELWLKSQRQFASGFFARRRNPLYRKAATAALAHPEQAPPTRCSSFGISLRIGGSMRTRTQRMR